MESLPINDFLFSGKLKQMKVKNEKTISKEEQQQDEKSSAVDQIKKKYGFSLHGVSNYQCKHPERV